MPDRPTAERGHLPASIFERNRVLRCRNHPKTSENLIFCELRNFNSETSSLVTLPSSGESTNFRFRLEMAPVARIRGDSEGFIDGYGSLRRVFWARIGSNFVLAVQLPLL